MQSKTKFNSVKDYVTKASLMLMTMLQIEIFLLI